MNIQRAYCDWLIDGKTYPVMLCFITSKHHGKHFSWLYMKLLQLLIQNVSNRAGVFWQVS